MDDTRRTQGEWRMNFGEVLLHYERFLFLPPPLNLVQFFAFILAFIANMMCCRTSDYYRWFLLGHWTTRDRVIGRLSREKEKDQEYNASQGPPDNSPGPQTKSQEKKRFRSQRYP